MFRWILFVVILFLLADVYLDALPQSPYLEASSKPFLEANAATLTETELGNIQGAHQDMDSRFQIGKILFWETFVTF